MLHARSGTTFAAAALVALTSCSVGGSTADAGSRTKTVVVASHDSWAMPKSVIKAFEKKTGYTVKIETNGDAGQLTNKLVLTKNAPIADLAYGVDNTFESRAVQAGVYAPYTPKDQPTSTRRFEPADATEAQALTPVDYGDVCVNVDDTWFAKHHTTEPRTLDDLTKPAYKNLLVTPGAATSSTGLAFLLGTVGKYGENGWQGYWKKLVANGVKVDAGWSDAYEVDFTGGGGKGDRPIVVSYASSPPFTIPDGASKPTTSALLDTCFRQVEYAGVLNGARNPKGAQAFIDFMLGRQFQSALPDNMYVYPADTSVALPATWSKFAAVAPKPFTVAPQTVSANRDAWLRAWSDIATG